MNQKNKKSRIALHNSGFFYFQKLKLLQFLLYFYNIVRFDSISYLNIVKNKDYVKIQNIRTARIELFDLDHSRLGIKSRALCLYSSASNYFLQRGILKVELLAPLVVV